MLSISDLGIGTDESQAAFAKRMYNIRGAGYENSWHPSFAAKFVDLANIEAGEHVLDLACGTGLVTFDVAQRIRPSGNVIGIDISEGMLEVAKDKKTRLGDQASNVQLYLHDIVDLDSVSDLQSKTFDVITVASALVLLSNAHAALKHWTKYLKPGGRLVVDVPHERNLITGKLLELVSGEVGVHVPYARSWVKNQNSLKDALEAAGLTAERQEFVEQAGYGIRYYDADDAEDQFVSHLMTESGRAFRMPTERREKALALFKQKWAEWSVDGKLKEIDGVYVAVARKPS